MITPPKSASFKGPTSRMTTSSPPSRKLNGVRTLAHTISRTERVGLSGRSLTRPWARRWATSAEVSPSSSAAFSATGINCSG